MRDLKKVRSHTVHSWRRDNMANLKPTGRNLLLGTADYTGDIELNTNINPIDPDKRYNTLSACRTSSPWQGGYFNIAEVLNRIGAKVGDVFTIQIMFMVNFDDLGDIDISLYRVLATDGTPPTVKIAAEPNKWYKVSFQFTVNEFSLSENNSTVRARIELNNYDRSLFNDDGTRKYVFGEGKYAWLAGYKLELGTEATPWTPAPEDNLSGGGV